MRSSGPYPVWRAVGAFALSCALLVAGPGLVVAAIARTPPTGRVSPADVVQSRSSVVQSRSSVVQSRSSRYRWPLDGTPRVTRRFDPPSRRWLPGHRGVDLAAASGATVRAAGAGVVRFAGVVADRGAVSVDHADGLRTTYEPVRAFVAAGDEVGAGDLIGVLDAGHAGCPVGACLHWGLRRGGAYLDPLVLLGLGRVRLLPRVPFP